MGLVCRVSDALDRLTRIFIQVALAIIVTLVIIEVFARNVFSNSLTWIDEVSVTYLGTWFVFVGAAHAMKVGMLINFNSFVQYLEGRSARALFIVSHLLILVFLTVVIIFGVRLSFSTMSQPSPALQLPIGVAYFGVVAGCAIMFVHAMAAILQMFTKAPKA
jgi:TRAP-type C4-dicarboxylate transport system permease small subunit